MSVRREGELSGFSVSLFTDIERLSPSEPGAAEEAVISYKETPERTVQ